MLNTILMDLDGTLLPFDQTTFINTYFPLICRKAAPYHIDADALVDAVWSGTKAMIRNDGRVFNRERFWDTFCTKLGAQAASLEPVFDRFYEQEFDSVRTVLREATPAKHIVETLKKKGYTVVLATNPIFPPCAVRTRLGWADLTLASFDYVTHYENSRFCKPNPAYYREILQVIGKTPQECLMAGNNTAEDMVAGTLGMATYLVTGYVENEIHADPSAFQNGSIAAFSAFCDALPPI